MRRHPCWLFYFLAMVACDGGAGTDAEGAADPSASAESGSSAPVDDSAEGGANLIPIQGDETSMEGVGGASEAGSSDVGNGANLPSSEGTDGGGDPSSNLSGNECERTAAVTVECGNLDADSVDLFVAACERNQGGGLSDIAFSSECLDCLERVEDPCVVSECDAVCAPPPKTCTKAGLEMIQLVNDYREANGLPRVPISGSMCTVATRHVIDLAENAPHEPSECNLHSWSDQGTWSACCYQSKPTRAQVICMNDKPRQLTEYSGDGFEIAGRGPSDPARILEGFNNSPGHNAVILNEGDPWSRTSWGAIGADIHGGFTAIWFGVRVDSTD